MIKKLISDIPENTAYYIENPLNLRYFTGTAIDTGVLVVTANQTYFLTDFRYIEAAKAHFADTDITVIMQNKLADDVKSVLESEGIENLAIEAEHQHISRLPFFEKLCGNVITDGALDKKINALRMIKQPYEIENIKKAQAITDAAFTHILPYIKPGVRERDIALEIEFFMRKNGASGVSFDLITITGKKTSLPHGIPSDNAVSIGDFVTMDIGCKVNGYCSDMTRTVAVGSVTDEMKTVYDAVLAAQQAALDVLRPGLVCSDGDKAARDVIYNAGYKGCFGHATGHSVGLFIHESPTLSPNCHELLQSGMIMTVEPGIYLENKFGVRIEDMVLITDNGIENLTKSDKQLIVL